MYFVCLFRNTLTLCQRTFSNYANTAAFETTRHRNLQAILGTNLVHWNMFFLFYCYRSLYLGCSWWTLYCGCHTGFGAFLQSCVQHNFSGMIWMSASTKTKGIIWPPQCYIWNWCDEWVSPKRLGGTTVIRKSLRFCPSIFIRVFTPYSKVSLFQLSARWYLDAALLLSKSRKQSDYLELKPFRPLHLSNRKSNWHRWLQSHFSTLLGDVSACVFKKYDDDSFRYNRKP